MNNITFRKITTHNLKKIDISIPQNAITSIYGKSGAGKSSLAFSTIYQLCRDEFSAIEDGYIDNYDYFLSDYSNLIPAVAISQKNTNNNPRSNLYSYLNIPQLLTAIKVISSIDIPDYHFLKIHSPSNECQKCSGLGVIDFINYDKLIDYSATLSENPFCFWTTTNNNNLYHSLLIAYANSERIPTNVPFLKLSDAHQKQILYGKSSKKVIFNAKYANKNRQRRSFYIGAKLFINKETRTKNINEKIDHIICPECYGSGLNVSTRSQKTFSFTFADFLLKPIDNILKILEKESPKSHLFYILDAISSLKIGYLNLARSIPSLSGGELQKIKFSRLLLSNITNILIIIDEISAQLNPIDYPLILEKIKKISKKNTVILIDHSPDFIELADYKIHIGKEAGSEGGYICKNEIIESIPFKNKKNKPIDFIEFNNLTLHNIHNQNVKIPKKCLTVFTGVSGAGKSSLAKAISFQIDSIYISQKNSNYSTRSILSSTLGLTNTIADYFGKKLDIDSLYFNPLKNGGCPKCNGTGIIKYERSYEKDIFIKCKECNGLLFDLKNPDVHKKINGLSIIDIYNSEIKKINNFFQNNLINNIFQSINNLGLNHLQLNRQTQTLSSGEIRRLRISQQLYRTKETNKILIVDEPTAGLDPETTSIVFSYIHKKVKLFQAIIVIDHKDYIIDNSDYKITIGPSSGPLGGHIIKTETL